MRLPKFVGGDISSDACTDDCELHLTTTFAAPDEFFPRRILPPL
jgi:hypothetical protein